MSKMMSLTSAFALAFAALGAAVGSASAQADNLITNGGFETGDFTGWSANVQSGSNGSLFVVPYNGGHSPISGFSYASNPSGGDYFALTDQHGPGLYSLTQSFTLGSHEALDISFDFFANNYASGTFPGHDYTVWKSNLAVDHLA